MWIRTRQEQAVRTFQDPNPYEQFIIISCDIQLRVIAMVFLLYKHQSFRRPFIRSWERRWHGPLAPYHGSR
jgi:hypothetical protein